MKKCVEHDWWFPRFYAFEVRYLKKRYIFIRFKRPSDGYTQFDVVLHVREDVLKMRVSEFDTPLLSLFHSYTRVYASATLSVWKINAEKFIIFRLVSSNDTSSPIGWNKTTQLLLSSPRGTSRGTFCSPAARIWGLIFEQKHHLTFSLAYLKTGLIIALTCSRTCFSTNLKATLYL